MENLKQTIDYIYNPDNQSKKQLINSFVVRLKTFQRLFDDIKGTSMAHPAQHYLIEGKRGMGKTTLLLRLGYEIENDKTLSSWLIPVVFNEEEYSIRKLYKLWERIANLLEEKDDLFYGLFDEMDASFDSYPSEEEYEYGIYKLLNKRLEEKGKKLILFIDNFGDIFKKFNKQETQRLRTVLQTCTNFRIFGASSTVLEAFYDNKHPFFEFFKVTRLPGLNKQETIDLLLKLSESLKQNQIKEIIENQPGRVETLRRLTGGVIRTIVLLSEIFVDQKQGNAFSDLESILDRVTPLYKHRMDDLPAQQQEIVEAIAFAWDAINVSEISQKTRIPSKTVSAQLRQMEKNEIITKKLTHNKNHLYQVNERFFNIWYLMRHGRKGDKRKVAWLVRFLEEWCNEKDLIARAQKHILHLNDGNYNEQGAYYLTEALARTSLPKEKQDELIKTTKEFLLKKNSEYAKYLSKSDLNLAEEAEVQYGEQKYTKALKSLNEMKDKDYLKIAECQYKLGKDDSFFKNLIAGSLNGDKNAGFFLLTYTLFLLGIEKSINLAKEYLQNYDFPDTRFTLFPTQIFVVLLCHKEYDFLYKLFTSAKTEESRIRESYKPFWYALMYYMKSSHPTEYLRMGDELTETVEEILKEVEQARKEISILSSNSAVKKIQKAFQTIKINPETTATLQQSTANKPKPTQDTTPK